MFSKNTAWSLAGGAIPALAALASTPYMIAVLGLKLFAVTSLILSITIFFYVYDLGMSRTMTFLVSKLNADERNSEMAFLGSALISTLFLSVLITIILFTFVPYFVETWLEIDKDLLKEATLAFKISALGIAPGLIANILKGVLEGKTKFKEANICKIFSGTSLFFAPMLVIALGNKNLVDISIAIISTRYLSLILYGIYSIPVSALTLLSVKRKYLESIWNYAIWAAISGFVSTTFVYGDRFIVAGYINPQDLSIYIASQDILIRYLLIPWSMSIVLMPTFSANKHDNNEVIGLYRSQQTRIRYISIVLLSLVLIIGLFATSLIEISMISKNVQYVVLIQVIGIFFCSLSQLPLIYLFGRGVPKLVANIFLLELVAYILIAPFIFRYYGLLGACLVWTGRLVIEYFLLRYIVKRLMK